jgi:predicted DNA-binding transcriptional regulator AlpA
MQTSATALQPLTLGPLPHFVTVAEFADYRRLNRFTVYHWLKDAPERLPRVTRLHGRVLFLKSDIEAWEARLHPETAATQPLQEAAPLKRRRGRPTKAEQLLRRQPALSSAAVTQ